ncbi:hypothetical protein NZD89_09260 [Alicyclobacillus fastidiosus]|uniref:Uncharacterized protein n=1 Tax=Alicyclobacillus fastidiosus TaxID=392011 RepID=A0ABY6ZKU5_9BACL|nr:hypothetical protein [Alicyclobacillus fastidiosus]WAH43545.1 hypothetical protein NZD89_09260 [Alicyclobacillus fastidiosus]
MIKSRVYLANGEVVETARDAKEIRAKLQAATQAGDVYPEIIEGIWVNVNQVVMVAKVGQ